MAHPGGRPKLPTELKVLRGTLNTTREKENPSADTLLSQTSVIVQDGEKITTPKTIQTRKGKQFYKAVVNNMRILHVLSKVDLNQIETMARYLERMHQVDDELQKTDINDMERYQYLSNMYDRLSTRFDTLASKFYISPSARVQLKLTELNAVKVAQDIEKNDNAVNRLLNLRNVSD